MGIGSGDTSDDLGGSTPCCLGAQLWLSLGRSLTGCHPGRDGGLRWKVECLEVRRRLDEGGGASGKQAGFLSGLLIRHGQHFSKPDRC